MKLSFIDFWPTNFLFNISPDIHSILLGKFDICEYSVLSLLYGPSSKADLLLILFSGRRRMIHFYLTGFWSFGLLIQPLLGMFIWCKMKEIIQKSWLISILISVLISVLVSPLHYFHLKRKGEREIYLI